VLKVGERFATTARIVNPDRLSVDRIEIMLDYPERTLKPLAIHTDHIVSIQREEPVIAVDRAAGRVAATVELAKPTSVLQVDLITIEWEAIAPTERAQIEPCIGAEYSGAYFGKQLQSDSVLGPAEAVTGATIRINPEATEIPQGMKMVDYSLDQLQTVLGDIPDQSTLRPPTLWIDEQSSGSLEAGDWLIVDFGLNNPEKMIFDEVRLACRYDPAVLEIVDADRENMLAKGINLLDGLFHDTWGWDAALTNNVNNKSGVFYYRSSSQLAQEMPSGVIARAICRIKKTPPPGPVFTWIWNAEAPAEAPQTGVYFGGRNVYLRGKDEVLPTALEGAVPAGKDSYVWMGIEKANPDVYKF
jgi:hypothetical protein